MNGGGERAKVNHSIGCGAHYDHAKRQEGNILLKFDIAIEGDKCIAMLPGAPHQFAIEHAAPAELNNGAHIVPGNSPAKSTGMFSSRRMRIRDERIASEFQGGYCLLAFDRRELMQELVQRLPAFDVVEQDAHSGRCKRASRSMLEHRANLLERNAGKPLHELGSQSAIFKIFEQCGNRHAGACEHPGTTYALWMALNRRA